MAQCVLILKGSSPGTTGVAKIVIFLKHFVRFTCCSKEHHAILLMDKYDSLIVEITDLATLRFPPHCSHKLYPFKHYFRQAANIFSNNNLDITIHDIAGSVGEAFFVAFNNSQNITAGVRVGGISPFNRNVFRGDEFAASNVTDREDVPPTDVPGNIASLCKGDFA